MNSDNISFRMTLGMNTELKITAKKKSDNLLSISIAVTICIFLFATKSSTVSILLYALIAVMSLSSKNRYIPFILVGASSYLPAVYHLSPLIYCTLILFIVLLKNVLLNNRVVLATYTIPYLLLLLLITAWSFITGSVYNDLSFFVDLISISIFVLVLATLMSNYSIDTDCTLKYFVIGLGVGLILTLLIKLGISGFNSTQLDRLAIGERADPNSTALLIAIFCIYVFIILYDNLMVSNRSVIGPGVLVTFGVFCLISTQSRGAILCLLVTMILYAINRTREQRGNYITLILKLLALILLLFAISILFTAVTEFLLDSWNTFYYRLLNPASKDGERIYLFKKSIEVFYASPVTGMSLNAFEAYTGHLPHSAFSDYMVTNGVVGIVFYGLFFIKPLYYVFSIRKNEKSKFQFYTFLLCALNMFFYSASNEKIPFFLHMIFIFSINYKNTKKGVNAR